MVKVNKIYYINKRDLQKKKLLVFLFNHLFYENVQQSIFFIID